MESRGIHQPLPVLLKNLTDRFREETTRKSTPKKARSPRTTLISVIIPAHNEEGYLASTLDALRKQHYDAFEIIVVANGCTDNTVEEARGRYNRLIVLSQKSLGVSRNLGARMARGELLLFLDADTILEPSALRRIAREFTRKYAAGTVRGCPDTDRLGYKVLYGLKNCEHRFHLHAGSVGVILCWKKHFMKVGGFDERLEISENSELMRRLLKFGRYKFIGDTAATTSMRRYNQRGLGRMIFLWTKLWFQAWLRGHHHGRKYETVR